MAHLDISIVESTRLVVQCEEKAVPLSLLDCTAANFSNTSAIWLYEKSTLLARNEYLFGRHLRKALSTTLQSYPQWCGHLKAVESTDGTVAPEARHFPPHARRFGRLYAHFGTENDPGVEFVYAKSSVTLNSLYPPDRISKQPFWPCESTLSQQFIPPVPIAQPLKQLIKDESGRLYPLLAVQVTELTCGGFVLALNGSHPLADATTFISFLKDWASVSQCIFRGESAIRLAPVFNPTLVDTIAAGDINIEHPGESLVKQAKSLPMHRYDWWAPGSAPPWPFRIPKPFDKPNLEPVGNPMPWADWDITSPVSKSIIHFSKEQVKILWEKATEGSTQRLSQHDAVLAHIWSCIARARRLENDKDPFHCDLVYGVRSSFQLDDKFLGSPVVMMNIELPASQVCDHSNQAEVAIQVRNTLGIISNPYNISAHLHTLAHEKSPQRIWQAFLGRRHILVTTWARAGAYGIDFGLSSRCVYVEGIVPAMDGNVLIKEAPGPLSKYWTDNGVDISIHLRTDDMEHLAMDPLLFPTIMLDEKDTR
ncbi:hydroxycinnamoyl-coenzyme a shikimate/quinate hydroxycinnamoyltransferase [Fusarium sporotrichioides]|uniref:Hydroxycinnamoyl-coenzyme a shikimate/quinate hydroxycinnamoyltransferase n=1 Tax=Fusarium sporotrichioides TaxID=5514 RepID=A0A395RK90_FUSSP|nr:hydroxycinnamoyl-coenzyme a shikimate/quinate hydroxycinnamoyltransferase [Fusarium sporotrichioides]